MFGLTSYIHTLLVGVELYTGEETAQHFHEMDMIIPIISQSIFF